MIKKKIILLAMILLLAFPALALAGNGEIRATEIFETETIALSQTATSAVFKLFKLKPSAFFSVHVTDLTDDGTLKLTYEISADGVTYVTPSSASDIVTAHTKTSGPGGDGNDLYSFTPPLAKYMRIIATETGGGNAIVITVWLLIQ
ncbi:hypothetical protein LCGC14_1291850 [marine sediment metagenome]|uniref:F5/8 type C domain-containing protein n=1 Tax=marine sediment metagenome TaxID=412755 RepID=A0A0F9KTV5_9ZZZZ